MESQAKKIFLSQFMAWIAFAVIGAYLLFSVNFRILMQGVDAQGKPLLLVQRFSKAITIPNINLGIDLQGGAHLVVSVEVEKAIENRLRSENKALDSMFKTADLDEKIVEKKVLPRSIVMKFKNPNEASAAYRLIQKDMNYLKVARKLEEVTVSLLPQDEQRIRTQAVDQAVSILERRLDTAGVQGLTVQRHGDKQIVVQLPGVQDVDEKKELISKTAHLEFKIVEKTAASRDALLDEYDGDLPADMTIVSSKEDDGEQYYLVSAFPDLTGDHIIFAKEDFGEYGRPEVTFSLDSAGAREFGDLTSNNVGRQLGIIIDNVMYSAPRIQGPITGGKCQITGNFTTESARSLAIVLSSGALKAPLKLEYETRVGASLGQDSIHKGIISCLVGLGLLLLFSIWYYKLAGLFAMLALFFNLFLVLLFLSWFKFALTLPGIAGMVLTIGMAIDASILIYERIREELMAGTTLRKAIQDGFSGAMVVIMDSNITTFLTGLVLFKFGSPAIRGFAVTLMAGIVATILAGVFFLKSIFIFMLDNSKVKRFGLD